MRTTCMMIALALAGCGSGGVMTSTDVKLVNPSARATSVSNGAYEVTFAVVNGAMRSIDRIEDVLLSTGGSPLQNDHAIGCSASPWTLPSGGASGVITLDVTFHAPATLSVQCDDGTGFTSTALVSPPSAPADSFDVRVEGLLTDAQPFVATGHAALN